MLYVVAIFMPPIAVFACGKPFQAIFINIPLTLLFYFPGLIHAMAVVSAHHTRPGGINVIVHTTNINRVGRSGGGRRRRRRDEDDYDGYDD